MIHTVDAAVAIAGPRHAWVGHIQSNELQDQPVMRAPVATRYIKLVTKYLFAAFYVAAGVNHFVRPEFYLKIMPDYLPWHSELVFVSGVAEVVLGAMLAIPRISRVAGWGLIALLIAIFPANVYVYQHQDILPAPGWLHLLRLPLQGVLILFAYWYTRPDATTAAAQTDEAKKS